LTFAETVTNLLFSNEMVDLLERKFKIAVISGRPREITDGQA